MKIILHVLCCSVNIFIVIYIKNEIDDRNTEFDNDNLYPNN